MTKRLTKEQQFGPRRACVTLREREPLKRQVAREAAADRRSLDGYLRAILEELAEAANGRGSSMLATLRAALAALEREEEWG